jgi:N-acetylglucosamine-6-sulfatase
MEEKLDNHYQRRVESLQSVDDIVEGVVRRLKEANKLDDTYIIYSSDNGFHLGHHRLFAGKKFAFEEDINVPLIIRGPGVPKGMKTDIVSAHVDLAPTILKMAGIEQRKEFDGRPIAFTQERIESRTKADTDEHTAVEFWTGATYLGEIQSASLQMPCKYLPNHSRRDQRKAGQLVQICPSGR